MSHAAYAEIAAYAADLWEQFTRAGFTHSDVEIWLMAERTLKGLPATDYKSGIQLHGGEK